MKTIVIDTNIWLSELALMSPLGCALSHYLNVSGFRLGLPEVIEIETKQHFKRDLYEYREKIKENYDRMLAIFGQMSEIVLPTDEDIERKVERIFDFHSDRIIRIPFDEESARDSLRRIMAKEPPNSEHNQQFKDGVIWANCVTLANENEVVLVTNDKAFYHERKYEKGLAENLSKEAQASPNPISICHELKTLLSEIRVDFGPDIDRLVTIIEEETYSNVMKLADRKGFEVKALVKTDAEYFATTDPDEVLVKFGLKYDIENCSTEQRTNSYIESRGEFLLNIRSYEMRNFINEGERVSWVDEHGEQKKNENIYGYLNATIGHRTVEHNVSYKLR